MGKMMTILLGTGIVLGIVLFVWFRGRRKKIREEKFQANKKVREDVLKQALANQLEPAADIDSVPHRPYRVNYTTGEKQENKEKLPLLQISEKNKLSEKKIYLPCRRNRYFRGTVRYCGDIKRPGRRKCLVRNLFPEGQLLCALLRKP